MAWRSDVRGHCPGVPASLHGGPVSAHRRLLPPPAPPACQAGACVCVLLCHRTPAKEDLPSRLHPSSPSWHWDNRELGGAAPAQSIPEVGGNLGKEVKVAALRGTQPSTRGPVWLLQPPPSPEPLGVVGVCGCPWEPTLAQAVMSAHRCPCLPVHARARVSGVCVFVGGLQWPPGPVGIPLVGPHGVQSGHQCQIVGSGGEVSPPTLAAGKGEGEREVRTSPQHY